MTDVQQVIATALGNCFEASPEQCALAASRVLSELKAAGIVGFIDQNATIAPRVYTDDDYEAWSDYD